MTISTYDTGDSVCMCVCIPSLRRPMIMSETSQRNFASFPKMKLLLALPSLAGSASLLVRSLPFDIKYDYY